MTVRSSGRTGLSKSLILKGMQCQRALWLAQNPPDFKFPANPEKEARLVAGIEVGRLARELFPGGTLVSSVDLLICTDKRGGNIKFDVEEIWNSV